MKKRVFLVCVTALAGLLACNREVAPDEGAPVKIDAEIEETRTALGEKDGTTYPNYWVDGDAISVNGVSSQPLSGVPAEAKKATFDLTGVNAPFFAAYPAAAVSGYSAGGATVTIPTEQTWASGTYDPSAFVMLGKADAASIAFHNAVCLFKLTVTGSGGQKISSVRLQANDSGIKLSGAFTTDFESISAGSGASNFVTVSSASGVQLGEAFYIAMAPADLTEFGLTIEITDTDGGRMSRRARPSKAYVAGKVYAAELEYAPKPAITASLGRASSSTLSFTWTRGTSVADDTARPYTIGVYNDAECTDPVVEYNISAGNECWYDKQPRFVFGGLKQDTDYWFKVVDTTEGDSAESNVVKARTSEFTVVTMPESITKTGIVLAEDFSELIWDFDYVDTAAGFRPKDRSSLSNREADSFSRNAQNAEIAFSSNSAAISKSRLANWAVDNKVYLHPGFLKLGTASAMGWILTPEFPIPEGKEALVRVSITGARYSGAHTNQAIFVLTPDQAQVNGITSDFIWPDKVQGEPDFNKYRTVNFSATDSWETQTATALVLRPGDRIAYGTYEGADASKSRCFISDITVDVLELMDDTHYVDEASVHGYVRCSGSPLAGVVVSDGYIVTQTDASGYYSMKSSKQTGYVFVSIPSGYKVEKNGVLPQFFKRTSQPAATAEELDFDLLPDEGQDNHTMLFFGDIHLASRTNDKKQFATFTTEVNNYISTNSSEKVYAMTLGDMTWDQFWYSNNFDLSSYAALAANMPNLQVFHTIGNHDHDMNATGDWDTVLAYRNIIAPNWYSFNIGRVHYMVVDNIECTNKVASTTETGYRTYNHFVVSDVLDWIKKDLQYVDKNTPIVVTMHAPVWNETGTNYLKNTDAFTACFNGYSDVRFISGHTHNHRTVFKGSMTEINSGAVCAAWWWGGYYYPTLNLTQDGAPNGYRIMHFTGTGMESRYKGVGRADAYQFRSYDRNSIKLDAASVGITASANASAYTSYIQSYGDYGQASSANEVIINVWDYDDTWKVEASEDNVNFTKCTRFQGYDPLYILVYVVRRFKTSASTPSFQPKASRHMFKYTASSANATVYIRVTDDEGRVYTETMTRPKAFKIATYQ